MGDDAAAVVVRNNGCKIFKTINRNKNNNNTNKIKIKRIHEYQQTNRYTRIDINALTTHEPAASRHQPFVI